MELLSEEDETERPYDYSADAVEDHSSRSGQLLGYADAGKVEESDRNNGAEQCGHYRQIVAHLYKGVHDVLDNAARVVGERRWNVDVVERQQQESQNGEAEETFANENK